MARRKRASMREGPLSDLFRSTARPDDEEAGAARGEEAAEESPTEMLETEGATEAPALVDERSAESPREAPAAPESPSERPGRVPPEPEEMSVYRVDEREAPSGPAPAGPPGARERLRSIFVEERRTEGPAFGRDEPGISRGPSPEGVQTPVIRVVGVGGAGVNAINRMVEAGIGGVEFLAVNTDLQSLQQSTADVTVHIGGEVTRGLGSGSDASLGYKAAFNEQDKIKRLLKGSDMVFIAAGVGGGTGTGASPVIARLAQTVGALTVGIVTKPFGFEGSRREKQAQEGIDALSAEVDTLIVIPNERLLTVLSRNTSIVQAFQVADDVLRQGVQGIADLVTLPALINLDFADVRSTMRDAGQAILGIGMGTGDSRALFAAQRAISSPLLETGVDGARSILLSITGGRDLSLIEVSEAAKVVQEAAHPDANIIFGANVDPELDEEVWVTVIATRFDGRGRRADGGSQGTSRRSVAPSSQRAADDTKLPSPDVRPNDLGIEAPEFDLSR
jgi:cell division protein FtsZ